jgi:hypothetical protein
MPNLPEATVQIDDEGGAFAGNTGYIAVFACAATNADMTPRVFSSTKALLSQHNYSKGVSYCASHFEETGNPVIYIGLPKTTAGYIGSHSQTGTGTSVISVAAGANGIVDDADVILTVTTGGTIGTNGIAFTLSLDGGLTEKSLRLGTANSYTEPYHGFVISFAAGTLVTGDTYSFQTFSPMWDATSLTTARTALAAQLKQVRSFLIAEDVITSTFAGNVVTEVNAYETANDRFVYARASVLEKSRGRKSKVAAETLTFAEVGVTGDTITRSAGSWIADGWRVGDTFTITGTVSNNISGIIGALTATVMTLTTADLVAEVIASNLVTMVASDSMAAYVSAQDAAYASIDGQRRIDLSIGQGKKQCPITGWMQRRPASWGASLREYGHDLQIPCWRKSDGPLTGFSLEDENGNVEEYDERNDGGALAAKFTCFRTYSNGPRGTFVALALTRGTEGSLLSRTHNMAVANLACTIAQLETENAIGQVLVLKSDGTGTDASLALIEERVNSALQINLLQDKGEGQRASSAVWRASRNDVLNVPGAQLNGTLTLVLNGPLDKMVTFVMVQTAG